MQRTSLNDDLEVVLQPTPASARTFSMTYVAPAGSAYEPASAGGLALAVGKLVVGRPGQRSREELARTLDRLGATLTSSVDPESAEVTVWGPQESWSSLLEIFSDALFRPFFSEDELSRVRRQLKERQLRQSVQPDLRAQRDLLAAVFPPGHPYHSSGLGNARSVDRFSLEALRRFHRSHYPVRGGVLAVTSSLPLAALERSLRPHFPSGSWGPEPPHAPLSTRRPESRRIEVEIPGQSQVAIRIGGGGIARSDDAYPTLFLANEVLGGRPLLSRMFQRIREKHGLAYHASSELEAMKWGGYWEALAGTDPATRERVVRLMLAEIERLSTDLVPPSELDRIRESTLGSLPLDLETTASAHELAVDVAYHHLPGDFYRTWPSRLRRIAPAGLRTAAETGFVAERAVVVTAGPPG